MQNPAFANTSRRLLATALLAALAALAATGAQAANLTWNLPGAGTWDTSSLNWTDGSSSLAWNNDNNDNASFGTLAANSTATLGTNITVNNLTFGSSTGVNVLAGGTGLSLTINGVITTSRTTTITAVIAGSNGLSKTGGSTLTLQGLNTYTGPTIIQNGSLQARTAGTLPATTTVTIGSSASNATLDVRASQTIAGIAKGGTGTSIITQTQTVGTSTLTIDPTGAGVSAADSTFSGTITDSSGTGRFLALTKAGSNTLTLTGTNNYGGATTVSGGMLKLGSSLNASNGVTISGGTLSGNDSAANITLGTGEVSMSSGSIAAGGVGTIGAFTLGSGQNFSATGGSLRFDLGSGATSDQIFGSGGGAFSVSGTSLELNLLPGFSYNSTYTLFSGFGAGSSIGGLTITGYDTANWSAALGTDGVLSFTATAIPEPATAAALFGVLALAAGTVRRRRA
jgi:autotransporter-associated beta strand protein